MIEALIQRKTLSSPTQGVWLITFGDLLTLLLCFFVIGLSHDMRINPNDTGQLGSISDPATPVGTSLAQEEQEAVAAQGEPQLMQREIAPVVKFSRADLEAAFTLNAESIQRVVEMYRNSARTQYLTVSGCAWSEEVAGATFERALLRQFIDAGIRSNRLRFGLPRPCTDETVLTVSHGG